MFECTLSRIFSKIAKDMSGLEISLGVLVARRHREISVGHRSCLTWYGVWPTQWLFLTMWGGALWYL